MQPSEFKSLFDQVHAELSRVIVGHARALEHLLVAVVAGGHVMLSGAPGLGRTLLVKSLARVLGLSFSRIQFTPDLLPTDITGTEVLQQDHGQRTRSFRFFKGPVFANLVLADEINRSPPRTQSALLEVMQERQVTVGGQRYPVPHPFLLVATQNSLETEGIFPLPEAQMDRFLMAIHLDYPTFQDEVGIVDRATGIDESALQQVLTPETLLEMQNLARLIPVVPSVKEYALALVRNTRPTGQPFSGGETVVSTLLRWGASPRGGQGLIAGSKVRALVHGRTYVTRDDIRALVLPTLAHRLILGFRASSPNSLPSGEEGKAKGQKPDWSELMARLVAETDQQMAPPMHSRRWQDILQKSV